MFRITQSNDTAILLGHLVEQYRQNAAKTQTLADLVFAKFTVIVPSMALGDWLMRAVADKIGISTLFVAQFWGQYQWQLIQKVLQADAEHHPHDALKVPEVAVLSGSVMRWRIFGHINALSDTQLSAILSDDNHPLCEFLLGLYDDKQQKIPEHRLWQACEELSAVYVRYLTHRPEWLHAWTHGKPLPTSVEQMLADKDRFAAKYDDTEASPDWLVEQYQHLEKLLGYLWQQLFAAVYAYRENLEQRFWAVLAGKRGSQLAYEAYQLLPSTLHLFTVQQIPVVELQFLKQLSVYINVHLLHLNPSQMFWADIVDKQWLDKQRIIKPELIYYKDHGHALLSRLGKESRETFAMLADMSGGEFYYEKDSVPNNFYHHEQMPQSWQVHWHDDFITPTGHGLLQQLKADILMLDEQGAKDLLGKSVLSTLTQSLAEKTKPPSLMKLPDATERLPSLSIHACHNLKRQLEIARTLIARYLNEPNDDGSQRKLADVVVYLPDVAAAEPLIRLVFGEGVGLDGLVLPAKITGTTNREIDDLMEAITGFYSLLGATGSRFYREDFCQWLMMPAVYDSFGLSFDEVSRACWLLEQAGFVRGFDAKHLAVTLDGADTDYRYSFAYALDRIVLGLITPSVETEPNSLLYPFRWQQQFAEASLPLAGVTLADQSIVEMLCTIYTAFDKLREDYNQIDLIENWLDKIETQVIEPYFAKWQQTPQMRAIFEAKNSIAASVRANKYYHNLPNTSQNSEQIQLSLAFVLESIRHLVATQAISAEHSGVITFARFGALRSIPFGLTLMLEMNLSAFPRQDRVMRMDLMRAGLKRRGDRFNEDDDNGAFLDALLCSRDACAIFYTAVAGDGTQLLPASPVGELLEFFKNHVNWQLPDSPLADKSAAEYQQLSERLPRLVEAYLLTWHAPTAFDVSLFYHLDDNDCEQPMVDFIQKQLVLKQAQRNQLPPAPLWQQVRALLDEPQAGKKSPITLLDVQTYQLLADVLMAVLDGDIMPADDLLRDWQISLPTTINITQLHRNLRNPASGYLEQKLPVFDEQLDEQGEEPLVLATLDGFGLKQTLCEAMAAGLFDTKTASLPYHQQLMNMNAAPDCQQLDWGTAQKTAAAKGIFSLYFGNVLPAGANRLSNLDEQVQQLLALTEQFYQVLTDADDETLAQLQSSLPAGVTAADGSFVYSLLISKTDECSILLDLADLSVNIVAQVPASNEELWLQVLPNTATVTQLLKFWLLHLAWQVWRNTSEADVRAGRGASIWKFSKGGSELTGLSFAKKSVMMFRPITSLVAKRLLTAYLLTALLINKLPIALAPANALTIVDLKRQGKLDFSSKNFSQWLENSYADGYLGKAWQRLLGDNNPLAAIQDTEQLADILYQPLVDCLTAID